MAVLMELVDLCLFVAIVVSGASNALRIFQRRGRYRGRIPLVVLALVILGAAFLYDAVFFDPPGRDLRADERLYRNVQLYVSALLSGLTAIVIAMAIPRRSRGGANLRLIRRLPVDLNRIGTLICVISFPLGAAAAATGVWGDSLEWRTKVAFVFWACGGLLAGFLLALAAERAEAGLPDADPAGAVLCLRAFATEAIPFDSGSTLEEYLSSAADVVALGNPTGRLGRRWHIHTTDADWQVSFGSAAEQAEVIAFAPSTAGNLKWELSYILTRQWQTRLFVVMPPRRRLREDGMVDWAEVINRVVSVVSFRRPPLSFGQFHVNSRVLMAMLRSAGYRATSTELAAGSVLAFDAAGQSQSISLVSPTPERYVATMRRHMNAHRQVASAGGELRSADTSTEPRVVRRARDPEPRAAGVADRLWEWSRLDAVAGRLVMAFMYLCGALVVVGMPLMVWRSWQNSGVVVGLLFAAMLLWGAFHKQG